MAAAVPIIAIALTAASTAISYSQSQRAGRERKEEANRAAQAARIAAQREAADTEKQHRRIIASQEALYGKAGLTMEGSPLLVQQMSLMESKEQLRRIRESGELQAVGYQASGAEAAKTAQAESIRSLLGGAESTYKIGQSYNWW